ncbi:hypothetical protein ACOSP7_023034 [Xanthoceras sorbifolium]
MNRMVNREAFRMIIPSIWKLRQAVDIEVIGANIFVFSFACPMDRRRALAGGTEPTGKGELTKMRFDRVMFWIQIHNTPLLCMNKETCSFLGSLIGEVVEVDSSMAGVSSPNEVLLNVGGSGGTVVLEKSGDCVVQVEVGKGRQKLAHGLLLHGGSEHLSDKCDAQEGKQNHSGPSIAHEGQTSLSWPSTVHGLHEMVVHETFVDKCDGQEGQKIISWQRAVHGEHAKVVAQPSGGQGGPETEIEQGLLKCSSKLEDAPIDHAKAPIF